MDAIPLLPLGTVKVNGIFSEGIKGIQEIKLVSMGCGVWLFDSYGVLLPYSYVSTYRESDVGFQSFNYLIG